jgi:hypothetical protein
LAAKKLAIPGAACAAAGAAKAINTPTIKIINQPRACNLMRTSPIGPGIDLPFVYMDA